MKGYRTETDSLGEICVSDSALWGAQTQRAVENFPISGLRIPRRMIRALGLLKKAAAQVNHATGRLDRRRATAIIRAAEEVADGKWDSQFPVDIFQTGSGTSSNMNANEVVSNRAIQILKGKVGSKSPVHPNDHVNMGQSSNDIIPTAMHIAAADAVQNDLEPALEELHAALAAKAHEFDGVVKIGRTHLQDAVPVRLGQEFSGYAAQIKQGLRRIRTAQKSLFDLALGGTAVGTGLNARPDFAPAVIRRIARETKIPFHQAENLFEALAAKDAVVEVSGALKTIAVSLTKIANDVRWLGSGPRCGIGEISLPDLQPGSSIMPGKVNPVMPEMMLMVCAHVIGNDVAVTVGGRDGNFELNVMKPMMAYNLLQSIEILSNAMRAFSTRCVQGLKANRERCEELIEKSLAMCTALAPKIGYDAAAAIAKESHKTGKTVRQIAREKKLMPDRELDRILNAKRMTYPGIPG